MLVVFLIVPVSNGLNSEVSGWYFHSTWVWLGVMAFASGIFLREMGRMRARGADASAVFRELPPE